MNAHDLTGLGGVGQNLNGCWVSPEREGGSWMSANTPTADPWRADDAGTPPTPTGQDRRGEPFLPAPTLPTGGGAIRGMGEAFSSNPTRGNGALTIPLAVSPGRSGASLGLTLTYDSGAGSSEFGLGFSLGVPAISRRTSHGVPRYTGEDVYQFGGVGDLVPALRFANGQWEPDEVSDTVNGQPCRLVRYRPRVEAGFARIERCEPLDGSVAFWRTVTRDNVTSVYGRSEAARVAGAGLSGGPPRVARWLLEEVRDDRGGVTSYDYKPEDLAGVDPALVYERSRLATAPVGRYLKRIRYANATPGSTDRFCLLVVLDYGEHDLAPDEVRPWPVRPDPYSSYRTGFEVRTWRLCRRILMFHDFGDAQGPGPRPRLVRSTDLTHAPDPVATKLTAVRHTGYDWSGTAYVSASLPALELGYTTSTLDSEVRVVTGGAAPQATGTHWVDLDGDGIPGVLSQAGGAWWYSRNEGGGVLAAPHVVATTPLLAAGEPLRLADISGDGALSLVHYGPSLYGSHERTAGPPAAAGDAGAASSGGWSRFRPFTTVAAVDLSDADLHQVDLDGDGLADLLLVAAEGFWWHRSRGRSGYEPARWRPAARDEEDGPRLAYGDAAQTIFFADLSGDGLADIVRVRNGEVCYWPNLGYGYFGAKVVMAGAPVFDHPDAFDPGRLRLGDVDGSGPVDIVYLGRDAVRVWPNLAGNAFGPPAELAPFPAVDGATSVDLVDLLGTGTRALVWTSPLPGAAGQAVRYLDLSRGTGTDLPPTDDRLAGWKPHLLCRIANTMGATTTVEYTTSTRFMLADRAAERPWSTRLPFPVQVVAGLTVADAVSGTRVVTRTTYHHGYYDGGDREFRGFGRVETTDTEVFPATPPSSSTVDVPPVRTVRWFHLGTGIDLLGDRYQSDPLAAEPAADDLAGIGSGTERADALRALAGLTRREEVYVEDGGSPHPVSVTGRRYRSRRRQPESAGSPAAFHSHELETLTYHYERAPGDPRCNHALTMEVDDYGTVRSAVTVGYPRRSPAVPEQAETLVALLIDDVSNVDTLTTYRLGVPVESRVFQVTGLPAPGTGCYSYEAVAAALAGPVEIAYEAVPAPATPTRRLIGQTRAYYWADDLSGPLPLGQAGHRALTYRTDRLVFTPGLLTDVYGSQVDAGMLTGDAGYHLTDGLWWTGSDVSGYDPAGFYQPAFTTDPFGNTASVQRDPYQLLVVRSSASATAPYASLVTVAEPDYRVLKPRVVTDPNGNRGVVAFDPLGMVVAGWSQGAGGDGDPHALPGIAVSYDLDAWRLGNGPVWSQVETRERHGDAGSPWQRVRAYRDGLGRIAMTKAQAEPGLAWTLVNGGPVLVDTSPQVRWVGTGRTVYNNKAMAVEQYEPYFAVSPSYEDSDALVKQGVTTIRRYDALGRLVGIDHPDGSVERIEFDAWQQRTFDANDTVLTSQWYAQRQGGGTPPAQARAAVLAAAHANTPTWQLLNTLGRPVRLRADNGPDGSYESVVEVDIQGTQRSVTDARGVLAYRCDVDLLGRPVRTVTPDAGTVLVLPDRSDRPARQWRANGHALRQTFDPLRRPAQTWVRDPGANGERLSTVVVYGEAHPQAAQRNLLGRPHRTYDESGLATVERFDLMGNPTLSTRRFASLSASTAPDWAPLAGAAFAALDGLAAGQLETEAFATSTMFDALSRPVREDRPDATALTIGYNQAGLLETLSVQPAGSGPSTVVISAVDYDPQRRRLAIDYGNGVTTSYGYDDLSRRLVSLISRRGSTVLQSLGYTYDPVGNVVEVTDAAQQTTFFAGAVAAPGSQYTYDPIYQLRTASGREHASLTGQPDQVEPALAALPHPNDAQAVRPYGQTYTYDKAGNVLSVAHAAGATGSWTRRYQYAPDSDRLVAHSRPGDPVAGPYSAGLSHDAAGNVVALPHLPGPLTWNEANRLRSAPLAGGGSESYRYDATGERATKVTTHPGGLVEHRLYLGGSEVYRRYRNGSLAFERTTVRLNDGAEQVALVETVTVDVDLGRGGPVLRYQLADHRRSSVIECDDTGQVISYEEYHPFGTTALWLARGAAAVSTKRYRYLHKEKDDATGLYQLGARYYACWLGRWISPDPAGQVDGTNLFRYSRDNPIRLVDPNGQAPETPESLSVTIPLIKELEQRGVKWAREVPYEVTVNGQTIAGRFDLVYQDPNLVGPNNSGLVGVEAKQLPTSPRTTGQTVTIPAMQAGTKVTLTGPSQGGGNLAVARGIAFETAGGQFVLVDKVNFGQVVNGSLAGLPVQQKYYSISTVDAQGKYEAKYFTSPEQLMEFHRLRVNPVAGSLSTAARTTGGGGSGGATSGTQGGTPTPNPRTTGPGREPDHFGPGAGGGWQAHGLALAALADAIHEYIVARTPEQKRSAIIKMIGAIVLHPAVESRLDPLLASAASAVFHGAIDFASRFSSGLFVVVGDPLHKYLPSARTQEY